jgi:hypothetical protein
MRALAATFLAGAVSLSGCAGPTSVLHTVHPATGRGQVHLELRNETDVAINNFYLAPSKRVRAGGPEAQEPGSPAQQAVWGPDLLARSAVGPGGRLVLPVDRPGHYDARAVDRKGREQHVGSFRLGAGGWYLLVLQSASWRAPP